MYHSPKKAKKADLNFYYHAYYFLFLFSICFSDMPINYMIFLFFQMSTFEITVVLQQGQQFGTALRSWFGQITNGTKSLQIGPHYSLRKKDLYTTSANESVTFHSNSFKPKLKQ